MEIKDGWKTTEFWVSISTIIIGLCVIFGLFTTKEASEVIVIAEKITGSLMAVVSVAGYAYARAKAKENTLTVNELLALTAATIGNLADDIDESEEAE